MALVTKYPMVSTHAKLYRGDPWAIRYRVMDGTDADDPSTWTARDLTGTFWRSHIRASDNGALLTKWVVTIEGDQTDPDERGWLSMVCAQSNTRLTAKSVTWDLEQVSNANDDAATASLGTVWKVTSAPIIGDVSWVIA